MAVFLRRWDASFGRRKKSVDGNLASMKAVAKKNNIDIWVDATPSGSVSGLVGPKKRGAALCPYSLKYPDNLGFSTDGFPRFENVYQASKVALWTPKHTQMLNGRAVLQTGKKRHYSKETVGVHMSSLEKRHWRPTAILFVEC